MKRLCLLAGWAVAALPIFGQTTIVGALQSYNEETRGTERLQQYWPNDGAFECESTLDEFLQGKKGKNRFTRALYGGPTDYRVETSDRPIFAVVKKNHHRNIRFRVNGVQLDSVEYCKASYVNGMRIYLMRDQRWGSESKLRLSVVACNDREGAVWLFDDADFAAQARFEARVCDIANPKLQRNGDIGADKPGVFEPSPKETNLKVKAWEGGRETYFVIDSINQIVTISDDEARMRFVKAVMHNGQLCSRVQFSTPDPYVNALAPALMLAADGDWDGQTWLHGCIGWRMPLAGWRAAYAGDALGWGDRAVKHFDAYAKSQVTDVEPIIPHPSQDPQMNLARAEKKWGTQMYSNGYICRNPERNNQMHHYDMNLNYMDELLWHFQYDADTAYMRKMWPVIERHLAWEKRNYDPDGDHLYDAYCCIWASDALYYSGGAVTHSSAYNYRGNRLAARIAEIIGKDPKPYRDEAEAILKAMNERLWMPKKGVWAEYQDAMGLKRLHESPAVWSIYTPIDCGACSSEQAWQATRWAMENLPTPSGRLGGVISTSNWMPYSWSINNVATAEVWHTALAYFEAGRKDEAYRLMMANVMDNMYYGQSPANYGQLSHYDAARGECYRDFGDCIGIASRTLLQGLFGVVPNALGGRCYLQPGFPQEWDSVTLKTPYIDYQFTRKNGRCRYEIRQHFAQPLKMILRQQLGNGKWREVEGNSDAYQVIEADEPEIEVVLRNSHPDIPKEKVIVNDGYTPREIPVELDAYFNSEVDDIFKNQYLSPRPQTTTLQIPVQGVGEWCHPKYTPEINDSVFRTLIVADHLALDGTLFRTPKQGRNIVYTSLWDNYPDSVTIPLKGKASAACLLMAGSTNHMQSRIDNGLVIVSYKDGTKDTLALRNPDNWCPIEQDYYVDGKAFYTTQPRPVRVCLGKATADGRPIVSRDLGKELNIKGVYGREIPGGAAQLLRMPLDSRKKLKSLTLRTLSNDVVIGLMAVTLQ